VHRRTAERQWTAEAPGNAAPKGRAVDAQALLMPPGADDERAGWSDEDLDAEDAAQVEAVTRDAERQAGAADARTRALWERERELLDQMQAIADRARSQPEAKLLRLVDWVRTNMAPGLPEFGASAQGTPAWNDTRLLVFTENREGTKRYLRSMLEQAIAGSDRAEERIEVIDGLTSGARRKEIQQRFNTRPQDDPLRILIATDAAREGLNFQAHCADLIHYDLPWNPGRIEQRNGRIDRKLQPADVVRCHYFVLPQRVEDRVLQVLVNKTETIRRELGSLARVIDVDLERTLAAGIRHADADRLAHELEKADLSPEAKATTDEELEVARERQDDLKRQIARCQDLLERSKRWVDFDRTTFRHALSAALDLLGAPPLQPEHVDERGDVTSWRFPALDARERADASWTATLDTLRAPRKRDQKLTEWRIEAPIRPVVFEDAGILTDDVVHLHLEQRVAQRLLARFRAQGFVHHDLSRAVLATSDDAIPRVVLLGRLSLYGRQAERLHEEIIPVTARWLEPEQRASALRPYAREAEQRTLDLLRRTLTQRATQPAAPVLERLHASTERDVLELRPLLEERAAEAAAAAITSLRARGDKEASDLAEQLTDQRQRVATQLADYDRGSEQIALFTTEERAQLDLHARAWRERLGQFERDLANEPDRIRAFYDVRASRIEPVGLAYLWPASS
jgi:superfamily II DNA/RNA helicase